MKSYTDLEQSKKLAEFLPLESADMLIGNYVGKSGMVDGTNIHYYTKGETLSAPQIIEAWSLAALLDVLPKNLYIGRPVLATNYRGYYWVSYFDEYMKEKNFTSKIYNNPIDACYEMIIHLHELNVL